MKLIASLTSPFARKVRVVLLEKKIECQLEVANPWLPEASQQVPNPLGKVPVLVLDDGSVLYDSRVIVDYLDHISPVSRLLPKETRPLAVVKRIEALADGVLDAAINIFLEYKRPAGERNTAWMQRQMEKVVRGLEALAQDLGDKNWMYGTSYSLADIAVGCALGWLKLRFPDLTWPQYHPNLAALYEKLGQRSSFADTLPPSS